MRLYLPKAPFSSFRRKFPLPRLIYARVYISLMDMDYMKESLKKHYEWKGKLEVSARVRTDSREALSLAYTPGVAAPCLAIAEDESLAYELTRKWNTVAVVTDGSAVLGLGNIGPLAGMPVMEGKCVLFR